ncbi:ubiquitin-associated protein 1-like isoform X2 [Hyperolius riggenbachi]|uniref:ubiquitin-associated protein 1-like isoform X2 n=1 Tax=Hyperolius riggenbachi TaxID=752182 RepID=UPI0035A2F96B
MNYLDDVPFKIHDGLAPVSLHGEEDSNASNISVPDCSDILMHTVHDFSIERKVLKWVRGMSGRNTSTSDIGPTAPPYWMMHDGKGFLPKRRSSPQRPCVPVRKSRSMSVPDVNPCHPRSSRGIAESLDRNERIFEEDGYSEDDEYSSSEESEMEARRREARARSCKSPQPQWSHRPRTSPFVPSPPSRCCCSRDESPPSQMKKRKSITTSHSSRSELEVANKRIAALVHPHKEHQSQQHYRSNCCGHILSPTPPPPSTCCCPKRPYSAGSIPPIRCYKPTNTSLNPYACLPPTRQCHSDCSGDVLQALSQEERDVIEAVTSMGYPLRRAMIALQKMGGQSLDQTDWWKLRKAQQN